MLNQNVGVEGKKVFKMLPLPLDEEGGGDNWESDADEDVGDEYVWAMKARALADWTNFYVDDYNQHMQDGSRETVMPPGNSGLEQLQMRTLRNFGACRWCVQNHCSGTNVFAIWIQHCNELYQGDQSSKWGPIVHEHVTLLPKEPLVLAFLLNHVLSSTEISLISKKLLISDWKYRDFQ